MVTGSGCASPGLAPASLGHDQQGGSPDIILSASSSATAAAGTTAAALCQYYSNSSSCINDSITSVVATIHINIKEFNLDIWPNRTDF